MNRHKTIKTYKWDAMSLHNAYCEVDSWKGSAFILYILQWIKNYPLFCLVTHGFSNILLSPTTCYGPLTNLERPKLHHTRNPKAHPYLKRFHLGIYIGDNFFFSPSINVCFIIWCIVLFNSKYIKIYLKKHGVNEYF